MEKRIKNIMEAFDNDMISVNEALDQTIWLLRECPDPMDGPSIVALADLLEDIRRS